MKGLFKQQLKQPKLAQLEKVLYKWFTAMHSKRKPVTAPMLIKKADNCPFSKGSLQNLGSLIIRNEKCIKEVKVCNGP